MDQTLIAIVLVLLLNINQRVKMTKRSIRIRGTDKELVLSKVTVIKQIGPEMIHFDKLADGTWRLIYSESTIPDITQVSSLDIVRED